MRIVDRKLSYGRDIVERFARQVAPFRSVLDLGAGRGTDLQAARRASPQAALHAVEFYPPNIERLEAQGVVTVAADLEREALPFADESMDLIISNQVFEHVKELFWTLHQMSRVLTVGGHAIIGVPNLASLHNRILLMLGWQPSCIRNASAHVRGFTRRDLIDMLNSGFPGGYSVEGFRGANFYPLPKTLARAAAHLAPGLAVTFFVLMCKQRAYDGGYLRYPVDAKLETKFFLGS